MATPTFDATHADAFSLANVANLTTASWTVAGNFIAGFIGSSAGTAVVGTEMKWQGSGGTGFTASHAGTTFGGNAAFRPFRLVSPAAASSTGYGNWGTNQDEAGFGMCSYAGVDTANPIGVVAVATGNNLAPALNVASAVGDLVVYGCWAFDTGQAGRTFSVATGTQRYTIEGASLGYDSLLIADVVAVGTTTAISITLSGSNPNDCHWCIYGFALKGAAAGGGGKPWVHYAAMMGS